MTHRLHLPKYVDKLRHQGICKLSFLGRERIGPFYPSVVSDRGTHESSKTLPRCASSGGDKITIIICHMEHTFYRGMQRYHDIHIVSFVVFRQLLGSTQNAIEGMRVYSSQLHRRP